MQPGATQACAGREPELRELTALYETASRTGERIAWLVGPSGVGKSRIVQEFRGRVRLDGGIVLDGSAAPGRTFGPFESIVEQALRFLAEVGAETTADLSDLGCRDGCHRFWHQHATSGHEPAAPPVGLTNFQTDTDAHERRARFFDALRGVLVDVARVRPPVVLLHDLERADGGTLELLHFLLDSSAGSALGLDGESPLRALFVATLREGCDVRPALAELIDHPSSSSIHVRTLDADGVRALLQSPEIVSRVLARTGGLPEAIDSLLDAAPPTPEERLRRQLLAFSQGTRALLEVVAVLDRPSEIETLCRIGGIELEPRSRQEFARTELLARTIVDGAMLFAFARASDRERAVSLLDESRLAELHAAASRHFEELGELDLAATHALEAGLLEAAGPLALEASYAIASRHAHHEAAAFLEPFIAGSSADVALDLHVRTAVLYRTAGDYTKAIEHARLAQQSSSANLELRRLGHLLMLAGEHREAAEKLELALTHAKEQNDEYAIVESEALLAELHYLRAAYDTARSYAERVLAGPHEKLATTLRIYARNTLGKVHLAQRSRSEAARFFEQNRLDASAAGLGHQEAQALTNLGVAALSANDLATAERFFEQGIEVALASGDVRDHAVCTENLAVLAHVQQQWSDALERYQAAINAFKRIGDRTMLVRASNNLGELYLSLGDSARARLMCEYGTHVGGATIPASITAESLLLRAQIEAAFGNSTSANAAFEGALAILMRIGSHRVAEVHCELATLAIQDGRIDHARGHLAHIDSASPKVSARAASARAALARAAGQPAKELSIAALEEASRTGDRAIEFAASMLHARVCLESHDARGAMAALERARVLDRALSANVPSEFTQSWQASPPRKELAELERAIQSAVSSDGRRASWLPAAPESPRANDAGDRLANRFPAIAGRSPQILSVLSILERIAPSDTTVLIRGESGTGKELVAEALHVNSARRDKPFVKVNCAALVETLLLSELFGHERGAFTGATARRKGRFELADGGTLFLDEIGDISQKTQVSLLRVLQEREFERVGGTQPIKVDVRIVCATHRDLEGMVKRGEFREDLYYRLRGVQVETPALRSRIADLPIVVESILARIAKERNEPVRSLTSGALALLARHRWPGNVRELENVLRSATIFADGAVLGEHDFAAFVESFDLAPALAEPEPMLAEGTNSPSLSPDMNEIELAYSRIRDGQISLFDMKKNLERECILKALHETRGNITRAAQLLGMKRPRLSQLVKEFGVQVAGEE